jgi:hypothetical protein
MIAKTDAGFNPECNSVRRPTILLSPIRPLVVVSAVKD